MWFVQLYFTCKPLLIEFMLTLWGILCWILNECCVASHTNTHTRMHACMHAHTHTRVIYSYSLLRFLQIVCPCKPPFPKCIRVKRCHFLHTQKWKPMEIKTVLWISNVDFTTLLSMYLWIMTFFKWCLCISISLSPFKKRHHSDPKKQSKKHSMQHSICYTRSTSLF